MRPARKSPLPPDKIYHQEETEDFLLACMETLKKNKGIMKLSLLGAEVPKTVSYSYKDLLKRDPQKRFLVIGEGGDVTIVSRQRGISKVRKPKARKQAETRMAVQKPIRKAMPLPPIEPPPSKRPPQPSHSSQLWGQDNPIREAFLRFLNKEQAWMPSTSKTICRHQKELGDCPLFRRFGSKRCTYDHGKEQKKDKARMAGWVRVMKDWDPEAGLLLTASL